MKSDKAVVRPSRGIDIEDAISDIGVAFSKASCQLPHELVQSNFLIAGNVVRLCTVGSDLAADIERSMCHLRAWGEPTPDLTIDIWDDEAVGPVGWTNWPEDVEFYGTLSVAEDARFVFNQRLSSAMLLDREKNKITGCVRRRSSLFLDERARPFHRLLSIWLNDRGIQFIHAGLTRAEDQGLLFVGSGGSGKSTSSVACLLAGFEFLSDDFVALEKTDSGRLIGHSIYATCLLANDHIKRFPSLDRIAHRANHGIESKSVAYLADYEGARFASDAEISAVILPKVIKAPKTTYRRAKPMEAMLALAPTSVIILPSAASSSLDKLGELVTTVPAYWLYLGTDVHQISSTIRQISRELGSNE